MPVVKGRQALRRYGIPEAIPNPPAMPEAPRLAAEFRKSGNRLTSAFDAYDQAVDQDRKKQHGWMRDVLGRMIQRGATSGDRVLARRKYRINSSGDIVSPALEESGEPFAVTRTTSPDAPPTYVYLIEAQRSGDLENAVPRVTFRIPYPGRAVLPVTVVQPQFGRVEATANLFATRVWGVWAYDNFLHEENLFRGPGDEPQAEHLLPDLLLVEFV